MNLDTRLVHAGDQDRVEGAVCLPIFQSANYTYRGEASYDDLKYIRLSNSPNHRAVQEKLADVAGGESALVTASGMAAISATLLALLESGDHALFQSTLYGGTHSLVTEELPAFGVEVDFIDGGDPSSWEEHVRAETKLIYLETMSNPLLEVPELEAAVEFSERHGLQAVIDNTFASPINFRPLEMGFDLSLHSCTKYLNGHSDIVAGCVIGSEGTVHRVRRLANHMGGCLDPHACFLLQRGMKTLALRLERQNENTLALARFLDARDDVERVLYPGLPHHPQHDLADRLLGGFGGVLSFEMTGDAGRADDVMDRLELAITAPSLGGVETLITRPVTTSHSGVSEEERERIGISDRLVRVAVGIESADDLLEDFRRAMA